MGEIVEFPSNGTTGQGYLATPDGGEGPGVVVIQEWWGLVDHIKGVCNRFAAEGFVALAPDLYHGESTTEPDEAGKKMMALNIEKAAKDMSGAVDYLRDRSTSAGGGVGVIGFCMGGGLALVLACQRPDAVKAVAPFYGVIPWPEAQPDYSNLAAAVQGHYAEKDDFANAESVRALEAQLKQAGTDVEMFIYPGADHAFFNDTRPEVYDAAAAQQSWDRVLAFLRSHLG
ncbi:MAG: carboxymethylenebutenolidase [Acidimicrobiaceae bacterium]|jgi:carboxymethylenebutenolidase|nr:carboxymethylenebutenolidase [Acidimicrobiaceae bacterium]